MSKRETDQIQEMERATKRLKDTEDFLLGSTQMGAMCRNKDWSSTPLGDPSTWAQSLRTAASICLNNRFPSLIIWGKDLTQIYNDGYSHILQSRHPHALGNSYRVIWAEIWDDMKPLLDEVIHQGKSHYLEDSLLWMLNNEGIPQERYFTYSFSPIYVEGGSIGGVLNIATETTERILGTRQLSVIRELGTHTTEATSIRQASEIIVNVIKAHPSDLPFISLYLEEKGRLAMFGTVTIKPGTEASPELICDKQHYISPNQESFAEVVSRAAVSGNATAVDLTRFDIGAVKGLNNELIRSCMILPFQLKQGNTAGVLVVGVSPTRPLDHTYQSFFTLLSGQVSAILNNAKSHEEERKKAEFLAELDRSKTTFFSNISHEFRTPITLMLGPIEELISKERDSPEHETLNQLELIHRNAMRLLKLVNTLLDFSRIEAGRMVASFQQVDIKSVTEDLTSVFRSACERAGLDYIVECEDIVEPVYIDMDMYEKIVLNLISNAYKFTLHGHIAIRLRAVGSQAIQLSIEDTGTGIPEAELPRIFERFHRVPESKGRTYEGTGIGLAMVNELVKLHEGTIQAYSKFGTGSMFVVTIPTGYKHLPQHQIKHVQNAEERRRPSYIRTEEWWLGSETEKALPLETVKNENVDKPRVLIVDDNSDMREYIYKLLHNNYHVEVACDGLNALECVSKQIPELILSDVMMPKLDGFGLLERLRNDPKTKTIPVIFLSARAGEEARVEGLQSGADDYLTKPFTARELEARIKTQIDLSRVRREAAERSEQANKAKDHFLAVLSHELRTPLTPALMLAESLEHNANLPAEIRRDLEMISKNIKLEVRLIDDLLDVTKITKNKLILSFKKVDVHKELNDTLELLKQDVYDKQINFEINFTATHYVMEADPSRLQQIFWNIIKNAIKFTPKSGKITITTVNKNPQDITILVTDTRIGIDSKSLPLLFQSFQQLTSSITHQFGGLGLGLSISKALTTMMKGEIGAESPGPNLGSTFYVTFPALPNNESDSPQRESQAVTANVPTQRILLVEDNKSTALVMTRFLKKLGHNVKCGYCVKEAMDLAEGNTFDFVISDLGLPDGSGFELMNKLKSIYGLRGICVSGYGMEEDLKKSKESGFEEHLVKPVELQSLKNAIASLVRCK